MARGAQLSGGMAALLALPCVGAYPERPVRLIIPWAAGGDTDSVFRAFVSPLQRALGAAIAIENVVGESGTLGAREAKTAAPDGYTLLAASDAMHLTYLTGATDVRYADFEPVCLIAVTPSILAASPKTNWPSLKALVAEARANPGQVKVAATFGSNSHVFPALVEKAAGVKFGYVSYEGFVQRLSAVVGGHAQLTDANLAQRGRAGAGELRFLAIATERRSRMLPNVPTFKELGYDVVHAISRGLVAPKGTAGDVLAKLENACARATREPAFADSITAAGAEVRYMDQTAFAAMLRSNDDLSRDVLKSLGLLKR